MMSLFKRFKKQVRKSISIYKAMKYLVSKIVPSNFNNIYTIEYSVITIHSLYPNVQDYSNVLKSFIDKQPNDNYIPNYDISSNVDEVLIKHWFLVNGVYTDPLSTISKFLVLVEEYLTLSEYYSELEDITYIQRKNLVAYNVITSNLYTLLEELSAI